MTPVGSGVGLDRLVGNMLRQANALAVPTMPGDAATALDALAICRRIGFQPDPWQSKVLTSTVLRQLLLCARQTGKSTVAALLAVAELLVPGALVLLISPTQRQSADQHRTVMALLKRLFDTADASVAFAEIVAESALRVELSNGARCIALPGSDSSTRGYSAATLVVLDEAARIVDALLAAILPTLATTNGKVVALTTPRGKRGWFFLEWSSGSLAWERTSITAAECPRITPDFLDSMKRLLGPHRFDEEFNCVFYDPLSSVFDSGLVARVFSDASVTPLWA